MPTTTVLRRYLTFTYRCALPFARRRVSPDTVTLFGLVLAIAVVAAADWAPIVAAAFVVLSAVTDGIDGCVAALTGRATRFGFVLDSAVDRVSDTLFVYALIVAGGHERLGIGAVLAFMALEYVRARAGAAGLGEIGVITVGERPTRTIAAALGLVGAQVLASRPWFGPNIGLGVTLAASLIGLTQLLVWLRRHLSDEPPTG